MHVNCVLGLVTETDVHSVSPTITVISPALDPRFVPVKCKRKINKLHFILDFFKGELAVFPVYDIYFCSVNDLV